MSHALIRPFLLSLLIAFSSSGGFAQSQVVNVYNWNDYIDPKVLDDFTKETGIRVIYDTFDNVEIVETKMLAGKSGYDVVVASAPFLQRFIAAGASLPLDRAKLSHHKNLMPEIMDRLKTSDPDNKHAIPYLWGSVGLGVNLAKVKDRLGQDFPQSWDLLLDPKFASKLKDCGIQIMDSADDVIPNILRGLKLDPSSRNANDLQKAGDALFRVRDNVQKYHSTDYINGLASGDVCLAVGLSSDIFQARKRAKEAGNSVEIEFILPREGASLWIDSLIVPKDAANADNAHIFINYLLRPDVAAANSNLLEYASANAASRSQIKPETVNNLNLYPSLEMMRRLFIAPPYDERLQRMITRLWSRAKTGK